MKNDEKITHIDLFSGIGGFALAADRTWPQGGVRHVFCDNDTFAQEVLKKHWPDSPIFGDIRELTADSYRDRCAGGNTEEHATDPDEQAQRLAARRPESSDVSADTERERQLQSQGSKQEERERIGNIHLLTGGFPCQPFSQAGRRRGTEDDRHLWPEMLRVIREFHPRWVIGENVGGLITWNAGMVLEQVHLDLEAEGYEVQAFVIPASAVGAPHRRDRVWIAARDSSSSERGSEKRGSMERSIFQKGKREEGANSTHGSNTHDADSKRARLERVKQHEAPRQRGQPDRAWRDERPDWGQHWIEVATRLCRVDDGIPRRMDRNPRLKALGNAIVPQVAEEIMRAIRASEVL